MAKQKRAQTSIDAYKAAVPEMISAHQCKIIVALRSSKAGMIAEQIAAHTKIDKHQVGRRTGELVKLGLIYVVPDEVRKTSAKRDAQVYKITSAGETFIIPQAELPGETVSNYSKKIQSIQPTLF